MLRWKIILILSVLLMVVGGGSRIYTQYRQEKDKELELINLRAYKAVSDSIHTYKDDRLRNYYQVTRIQDSIIEENTFTKKLKKNNKKLLDCSSKL